MCNYEYIRRVELGFVVTTTARTVEYLYVILICVFANYCTTTMLQINQCLQSKTSQHLQYGIIELKADN